MHVGKTRTGDLLLCNQLVLAGDETTQKALTAKVNVTLTFTAASMSLATRMGRSDWRPLQRTFKRENMRKQLL